MITDAERLQIREFAATQLVTRRGVDRATTRIAAILSEERATERQTGPEEADIAEPRRPRNPTLERLERRTQMLGWTS